MLFNSIEFLIFLPLVFFGYWFAFKSLRWQNLFVVAVSYLFYGWWDWRFLLLIAFTSLCSYASGLLIGRFRKRRGGERWSRAVNAGNILLNLTILGVFKYYDFFAASFAELFGIADYDSLLLRIILPVGISFYTFQALSYSIDVYREKLAPTRDIVAFFAFISFFPQLVAGPIERATNLLPQFLRPRTFDTAQAVDGLRQALWGFFKKIVVADNCAILANGIFDNYENLSGGALVIGAVAFSFQIYGDFSGYSDIAIGLSELFGIRMKENFNFPYLSRSITEFWRRWHISLGTWFREYLYIPLGGNRKGRGRTLLNLFAVFLVTGIWHGAGYNYILWGVINGVMIVLERCVRDKGWYQKIPGLVRWAFTMFVVLMSWQVFRLESMSGIAQFFGILFGAVEFPSVNFTWQYYFDARIVVLMVIATVGALALDGGWAKKVHAKIQSSAPLFCVAQLALLLLMVLSVMFMVNSTYSPFIYFQY